MFVHDGDPPWTGKLTSKRGAEIRKLVVLSNLSRDLKQ